MDSIKKNREILKSNLWEEFGKLDTDQKKQIPAPPLQKSYSEDATLIDLIAPEDLTVGKMPIIDAINGRRSRRKYTGGSMTLEEISYLLWATQGVSRDFPKNIGALRTVPSGGARHPFETYLFINRIDGLETGLYRYLFLEHKLCFLYSDPMLKDSVHEGCYGQYVTKSALVFIWTAIPCRTEWRYSIISPKLIALDAGHLCQNLYLAVESIGAGTCAIGAYSQEKMDSVLKVDGEEEFTIYLATVGKVR
jgi:SagB-type dehydrogenase family enzyme